MASALLAAATLGGMAAAATPPKSSSCKRGCTAPTAPTNLVVAAAGQTSLVATWSPATSAGATIVGYRVYVDQVAAASVTATSATLGGLSCGTTYTVSVVGVDSSGNVSPSAAASGVTAPCAQVTPSPAIWRPTPGTTWQWQITGLVDTTVPAQMFDIDLFDAQPTSGTPARPTTNTLTWVTYPQGGYVGPTVTPPDDSVNPGVIAQLHAEGVKVVCYLDSGAWESYRPDAGLFPTAVIGNSTGWSGERWLDIRRAAWPQFEWIIVNRMRLAAASGCDGVEPDQNNPVGNDPGFPITYADEKAWYLEIARDAHALGLSVGMKNGIEIVDSDLVNAFDWALNEQCFQYDECDALSQFVAAGKAVFEVEYQGDPSTFCPTANALGFSSMKKDLQLDAWREPCW